MKDDRRSSSTSKCFTTVSGSAQVWAIRVPLSSRSPHPTSYGNRARSWLCYGICYFPPQLSNTLDVRSPVNLSNCRGGDYLKEFLGNLNPLFRRWWGLCSRPQSNRV